MRFLSAVGSLALVASWVSIAQAARPPIPVPKPVPRPVSIQSTFAQGEATFQQQLDHHDPAKGTFSQRYWWSTEFWGGPGSPVS